MAGCGRLGGCRQFRVPAFYEHHIREHKTVCGIVIVLTRGVEAGARGLTCVLDR
jgi:hypothetical protein